MQVITYYGQYLEHKKELSVLLKTLNAEIAPKKLSRTTDSFAYPKYINNLFYILFTNIKMAYFPIFLTDFISKTARYIDTPPGTPTNFVSHSPKPRLHPLS